MTNNKQILVAGVLGLVGCGGGDSLPFADGGPHPDAPGARKSGTLVVQQETLFGTPITFELAQFLDGALQARGVERTDGPCTILVRDTTPPPMPPRVSAGTVTLETAGTTVTLAQNTDGSYAANQQMLTFSPDAGFLFAGSGAAVPAFSQALSFPRLLTSTTAPSTISKSGVSLSWQGTAPAHVTLAVDPVVINCDFTGVTSATIPASTLSDLPIGTNVDGSFQLGAFIQATVPAGDFDIDVQLFNVAAASPIVQVTP